MRKLFGISVFIIGMTLTCYFYFEWSYAKTSSESLTEKEIQEYEAMAKEKVPHKVDNTENNVEKVKATDAKEVNKMSLETYEEGEKIAQLIIPKLELKYSVYWGADDKTLKKGVGMFVSDITTTPDSFGHTVLSGHRDTVFTRLGELKEDDTLLVEFGNQLYEYKINKIWITNEEDRTVITKKNSPILTLTTCYPFDFIGQAPDRYIIQAELMVKA